MFFIYYFYFIYIYIYTQMLFIFISFISALFQLMKIILIVLINNNNAGHNYSRKKNVFEYCAFVGHFCSSVNKRSRLSFSVKRTQHKVCVCVCVSESVYVCVWVSECVCVWVCECVLVFIYRWGLKPEYTQPHGDLCHGGDLNWGPHG